MDIMNLMKYASKFKQVQNDIKSTVVEDEINGIKLAVTGSGEVKEFKISQQIFDRGKEEVERTASKVIESCLKKVQNMQIEKAKKALGGVSLPDIFA
jgi:DNA-binding protein YbaB